MKATFWRCLILCVLLVAFWLAGRELGSFDTMNRVCVLLLMIQIPYFLAFTIFGKTKGFWVALGLVFINSIPISPPMAAFLHSRIEETSRLSGLQLSLYWFLVLLAGNLIAFGVTWLGMLAVEKRIISAVGKNAQNSANIFRIAVWEAGKLLATFLIAAWLTVGFCSFMYNYGPVYGFMASSLIYVPFFMALALRAAKDGHLINRV